jgi:ABC-type Fe2+-enterobactin transport system substrate-binding protein
MAKRNLTEEEMKISTKMLEQRKDELAWLNYQKAYNELMLSDGLEVNYKRQIREFKTQLCEIESQIKFVTETIHILETQMCEGVEMIEKKKVKGGRK